MFITTQLLLEELHQTQVSDFDQVLERTKNESRFDPQNRSLEVHNGSDI